MFSLWELCFLWAVTGGVVACGLAQLTHSATNRRRRRRGERGIISEK